MSVFFPSSKHGLWPLRPWSLVLSVCPLPPQTPHVYTLLCTFSTCPSLPPVSSFMFRIMPVVSFSPRLVPWQQDLAHSRQRFKMAKKLKNFIHYIVLTLNSPVETGWRSCSMYPSRRGCRAMERKVMTIKTWNCHFLFGNCRPRASAPWSSAAVASEQGHLLVAWVPVVLSWTCFNLLLSAGWWLLSH